MCSFEGTSDRWDERTIPIGIVFLCLKNSGRYRNKQDMKFANNHSSVIIQNGEER